MRITVNFFVTPYAIDIIEIIIFLLCRCEYGAARRDWNWFYKSHRIEPVERPLAYRST